MDCAAEAVAAAARGLAGISCAIIHQESPPLCPSPASPINSTQVRIQLGHNEFTVVFAENKQYNANGFARDVVRQQTTSAPHASPKG